MQPFVFDASTVQPQYSVGGSHPVGLFDARITGATPKPVKDNPKNGLLELEYTTPVGKITDRFNLWNDSAQAVDISRKQLSAVCNATGRFKLTFNDQVCAPELIGADFKIEVGWQKGHEPSQEKPQGGYTEVKKVFDRNGNEPGKGTAPAPQPQGQQGGWGGGQPQQQPTSGAPMQQQPGGGWSNNGAAPQQNQPQGGGWGNGNPAPQGDKPSWAR